MRMGMSIDEYIERCEEIVRYNENLAEKDHVYRENEGWIKATRDNKYLAEWLKELKSLKEKEEPRAVRYEGDGYADGEMVYDYAYCPNCDHETEADSENWGSMFCPDCGQRLRWEE